MYNSVSCRNFTYPGLKKKILIRNKKRLTQHFWHSCNKEQLKVFMSHNDINRHLINVNQPLFLLNKHTVIYLEHFPQYIAYRIFFSKILVENYFIDRTAFVIFNLFC